MNTRTALISRFIAALDPYADSLSDAVAELSTTDGFEMLADEIGALIDAAREDDGEMDVAAIRECGFSDADLIALWEGGLLVANPTDGDVERTIQFTGMARLGARKAA